VLNADAGLEMRGVGPQGCEAAGRPLGQRVARRIERTLGSTPFHPCVARNLPDKIRKTKRLSPRRGGESLLTAARNAWTNESIRQKIIGHRMAVCGRGFGGVCIRGPLRFRGKHSALALFDQPAGDHGVGVFVEPLVEERRDFLAEIGGVAEAGKFIALESIAGSGEKKLPGRLGAISGHGALRWNGLTAVVLYCSHSHSMITSNRDVTSLWISVENEEKPARACSGCAGDYEDPDRSAWEEDLDERDPDVREEPGPDE
jgi:hypothetical protein